ncbi:MAG TPA: RNase H family protein [Pelagibacterium sp.]|uniref:RNase H family protein n=1 Tax=Pelagibacterium sp. TaxID=1967288 RepID=UPI002CDBBB96|nr:RNase H family protein [Pelagibacterium sp.]HWJ86591.1 RNase H family protein [Pelagibacterium sp.]
MDALQQGRSSLEWRWVKGHALHGLNETADTLASNAARGAYLEGDKAIRKEHPTWFK